MKKSETPLVISRNAVAELLDKELRRHGEVLHRVVEEHRDPTQYTRLSAFVVVRDAGGYEDWKIYEVKLTYFWDTSLTVYFWPKNAKARHKWRRTKIDRPNHHCLSQDDFYLIQSLLLDGRFFRSMREAQRACEELDHDYTI